MKYWGSHSSEEAFKFDCCGFVFYVSSLKTFIVHTRQVRLSRLSLFYLCKCLNCAAGKMAST